MVPEGSRNGASSERNACKATKLHKIARGSSFCQCSSSLLDLSGDPEGIPKSVKNWFFAQKSGSKRVFLLIFERIIVRHDFASILHRFFTKNQGKFVEKISVVFCQHRLFFEHCDPHETLYFTIRKLCFRFLSFCFFLEKYRKHDFKIQAAFFPTKKYPKMLPGEVFWVPKWCPIGVGAT